MKKILLIDSRPDFTADIESWVILNDPDIDVQVMNSLDRLDTRIAEFIPDEIIVSENILNGYQDWNRGVTVRTYAISQEGIHLSYQMGFDSYGVIDTAENLLEKIENQEFEIPKKQMTEEKQSSPKPENKTIPELPEEKEDALWDDETFLDEDTASFFADEPEMDESQSTIETSLRVNMMPSSQEDKEEVQEKNTKVVEHSSSSMQKEALVKEKIQEDVKTLNRKRLDSKENKRFQESIGEKRETTSDILGMHSKNREARDYLKSDDMDMSVRKSQQRKIDRIVERDMGNIRDAAKVITVYSAKGGVGKTTLSCELATYLALTSNGRNRYKVCIADFNIDFGDVKNTLNFDPNKACMSVWAEDIRERVNAGQRPETICYSEAEISKYLQVDKSSNLYALLAPFTNEDSMDINTYELEVIMRNLRENGGFDFIVCDTGNNTRDSSFIALENADIIIMVLTQCMNTALCNYGLLNTLYQLNSFDLNRIKLVINKEQSSRAVGISVEELVEADAFRNPETKKPYELLGTIKNSNKVKLAGNMGSPLVYDAASEFTKEIGVIASKIIGKSYVLPEMKKKGFFARLFGRK